MGNCDTVNNERKVNNIQEKNSPEYKEDMKLESIKKDSDLVSIEEIGNAVKSLCKIVTPNKIPLGFLIKMFRKEKDFFCLMTNEHIISKEMIDQKENIIFYYDGISEKKEINLNKEERFIKNFKDMGIDATIIEILPKDNIPKKYFLLTSIEYMNNFDGIIGKEITIIQYPEGKLSYSYGIIKEKINNYEFSYKASTKEGSSGNPILLKGTTRVIGIHKGGDDKQNYGDFIGPIFNYLLGINQMTLIYKVGNNIDKIKLFGSQFVENNKDKCYLLIEDQQKELCEYLYLNEKQKEKNTLEIKLIENKIITNMSYMFSNCSSLISIKDIYNWNTKNVTNMSYMFSDCSSLLTLPDISKLNTKNVTNMDNIFYKSEIKKLNKQKKTIKENSKEKEEYSSRIIDEFKELEKNPNTNLGITVGLFNANDYTKWRVSILGPKDTSYKNGFFFLSVEFPKEYPDKPPEVCYLTPIYHVNVNPRIPTSPEQEPLGHISIPTLNLWKPEYKMIEVLTNIFFLFYLGNPYSAYSTEQAYELSNYPHIYEEKIKYFTKKYANPTTGSNYLARDHDWDFNYP